MLLISSPRWHATPSSSLRVHHCRRLKYNRDKEPAPSGKAREKRKNRWKERDKREREEKRERERRECVRQKNKQWLGHPEHQRVQEKAEARKRL